MRADRKIVVVSDKTKIRLEKLKVALLDDGKSGVSLGGIVDTLVKAEYERIYNG